MTELAQLDDVTLGLLLRGRYGPQAPAQVALTRRLVTGADGHGEITHPFLENLAAELKVTRQAVDNLLRKLKRKGVVKVCTVPPTPRRKVVKFIYEPEQPHLPFGHAD